jgi:hypothetical protein
MGPESLPVHNLLRESHAGTTGAVSLTGVPDRSVERHLDFHTMRTPPCFVLYRGQRRGSNPHRLHPHGQDPKTRGGPPTLRFTYHAGPACAIHTPHFLGRLFRLHARKCLSKSQERRGAHTPSIHKETDWDGYGVELPPLATDKSDATPVTQLPTGVMHLPSKDC